MPGDSPEQPVQQQYPGVAYAAPPPLPPAAAKGAWIGVVSVFFGALGCLLPLAPMDLTGVRPYLPLLFGLPGLVFGIVGLAGNRGGRAWAVSGTLVSGIAVVLAAVMLIGTPHKSGPANAGPGDHTAGVLHDDLDVHFGEWHAETDGDHTDTMITLYNKGPDTATFGITIRQRNGNSGQTCETPVSVNDLAPGATYQQTIGTCESSKYFGVTTFQVIKADKSVD